MLNVELINKEYGFMKEAIFLNVSSVVMPPLRVQKAYRNFMDDYISNYGSDVVSVAWDIVNNTRPKFAKLVNAEHAHEVAFVKNTCEGISIIADGFPWQTGDEIVIADQEHQANLFPWINAKNRHNLKLNIVKSVDGDIPTQDMIDLITPKTKILTISAAQFSTGYFADLKALGEECRKRGVVFVVDGIQVLGRLAVDVQDMKIDYLTAGSNKGLLGSLGCGVIYCSDRIVKDIIPPYASYQSVVSHVSPPAITTNFDTLEWYPHARRFESGNLSYNCINAISYGMDLLLELGIENIEKHILELEEYLREKIKNISLHVVTSKKKENRSGIVCIYYPKDHEQKVVDILAKYSIYATMRGGYMRFGINFYNTKEQMELLSQALLEIDSL